MTIGKNIKARRMELKMSQRELSDRMGYSNHSTITRIEAGKVDIPQSKIEKFAEVLKTTPAVLMGWIDEETSKKNDIITDIVLRMTVDEKFLNAVKTMYDLDEEKFSVLGKMLSTFVE